MDAAYVMENIVSRYRRPEEIAEGHHRESSNKRSISGTAWMNRHSISFLAIHGRVLAVVHRSWQHLRLHVDESIERSCGWLS